MERGLRMVRLRAVLAAACLGGCIVATGCGSGDSSDSGSTSSSGDKTVKLALVESFQKEDGGWNTNFRKGVDAVKKAYPDATTTVVDQIDPGAEAQRTMSNLATEGYDVIIANGNFASDMKKVAPRFPDTVFEGSYNEPGDNMGTFEGADDQGSYVIGVLAGSMTRRGVVGYVSAYMLPAEARMLNAFTQGAKTVRPDIRVKTLTVNSYLDPAAERQAAQALVDDGADVLWQGNADPSSAIVAQQRGVKYVSSTGNWSKQAPDAWLGGFELGREGALVDISRSVVDGTWKPEIKRYGIETGDIFFYPYGSSTPADVRERVDQAERDVAGGEVKTLEGPITDNEGEVAVAAGKTVSTPAELFGCCTWLAEGVEGKAPQAG
jgi:basic membrane protein A and related proteins